MITLEQISSNDINVPLSYGWTSDYMDVIARIQKIKAPEAKKVICIQGAMNVRVTNDGAFQAVTDLAPDVNEIIGSIIGGSNNVQDTLFFVLGKVEVGPVVKVFYDNGINHIREQGRSGGNLITNTEDVARSMGVEDYNMEQNTAQPRVIIIGHESKMPNNMNSAAFYIGCVDSEQQAKDPLISGLNTSERNYVQQMMKILNPKSNRLQKIADIRKGVFSGSDVIKDISVVEDVKNIGGYAKVKEYYETRKQYLEKENGMIKIKGDLYVGPPGTGKSRILTAIPSLLGIPGFELDINAALGSLQGQSEQAFREAIAKAKKLAPCVLLLDEVEKMLSGVGEGEVAGNEVAMKLLGILLSAMAEKNGIYWIASANKISHIQASHPEFLRKGRFDNIWYVPLPSPAVRAKILGIHCRLNNIDIKTVKIEEVVEKMEGWSGAEIEHICKEISVDVIASGNSKVNTATFNKQIDAVKGISKSAKASKALEEWSKDNAREVD